MRISKVDLFLVEVPLRRSFRSSSSTTTSVRHPLVHLVGLGGEEGWGEAPTPVDPYYVGETPGSALTVINDYLAPLVVGVDWEHPSDVARALLRVKGNSLARSAVEMAAWDLWCRAEGLPLALALSGYADLAGGRPASKVPTGSLRPAPRVPTGSLRPAPRVPTGSLRPAPRVPAGAALGTEDDLGVILRRVDECVAAGYRRVKIKIAPGCDVQVVGAVRERHPALIVVADANGAYRFDDPAHLAALADLDGLGLMAIEQPLGDDDLVGHARLQEFLATAVALDEAITSVHALEAAITLGSCRAVSLKAPRLGGLTAALDLLAVCREHGIDAWCGGMHELGIGRAANLALASQPGFTLPGDMASSDFYFAEDLVSPPLSVEGGEIAVPAGTGLGVEVDGDRVDASRVGALPHVG